MEQDDKELAAFPSLSQIGDIAYSVGGMTLRDYFAGMALQGLLAAKSVYHFDTASAEAYSAADAMLEARKK